MKKIIRPTGMVATLPGEQRRARRMHGTSAAVLFGVAVLSVWLGAVVVCPGGQCALPAFDHALLTAFHALQRPWLDPIVMALTWLGSIVVLLPLALLLAWVCKRRAPAGLALLLPLAVTGAWLFAQASKLLVARPRPDLHVALITLPADLSFPSAHALQVTAFALACVLAVRPRPVWLGVAAAALLILAVALSRLYLQVHFPSDVLVGMLAGAAWTLGLHQALKARS